MTTPITMKHTFSSSAERVFAALNDHDNMGRWLGAKIKLIKPSTHGGVGAVRRLYLGVSTLDEEVIECVEPTRIVYTIVRGLFPLSYHRGEIHVTAVSDASCEVVWTIAIDSKIPLIAPIVRAALKLAIQAGLKRLDGQLHT
jgi:Polyketide cyclase / dehydrase and lipid transport